MMRRFITQLYLLSIGIACLGQTNTGRHWVTGENISHTEQTIIIQSSYYRSLHVERWNPGILRITFHSSLNNPSPSDTVTFTQGNTKPLILNCVIWLIDQFDATKHGISHNVCCHDLHRGEKKLAIYGKIEVITNFLEQV
ncbi:hypothetical protein DMA11_10040 [Marinilabiliaceae bacterium JC017]|nr:hypothetical protein DMA11_10040 [Marinilabiliaceae bacterium JC017]